MTRQSKHNNSQGFTILEVLIVIAVPIYNNNVRNAKCCEADIALGTIRSHLQVYYSDAGSFPTVNPAGLVVGASWNDIGVGELDGRFFSDSSYTYECRDGLRYKVICEKGGVLEYDRTLDQDGVYRNE